MKPLKPRCMDDTEWQTFADASTMHRNPADPDVADVLLICRHTAAITRHHALTSAGWVVIV
jgi:hypothetical protein